MNTHDFPISEIDKLNTFITAVRREYSKRKNAALALSWACSELSLAERAFRQIIIIGQNEYPEQAGELYLGKLVLIQPRLILFFSGDDLFCSCGRYYCGIASIFWHKKPLVQIYFPDTNVASHLIEEKDGRFLYWTIGFNRDGVVTRYIISDEMIEKIKNLFANQQS